MQEKTLIALRDQRMVLHLAFRYTLGRQTYVVGTMVDTLINAWFGLPKTEREMYHREINEAIKSKHAGSAMDEKEWERILRLAI